MSEHARVRTSAPRGMITVRADLSSPELADVVKRVTGQAVPKALTMNGDATGGAGWMSPDELLLMVPYDAVPSVLSELAAGLRDVHHLAVDVSDARAVFLVEGTRAADVLARLCPIDLHKDAFAIGDFRRTRMAQVAAAFWRHDTGFDVICFRSVAEYAERLLENAALGEPIDILN